MVVDLAKHVKSIIVWN